MNRIIHWLHYTIPGVMRLGVILGAAALPFAAEAPVLAHRITAGVPRASSAQGAFHFPTIVLLPHSSRFKSTLFICPFLLVFACRNASVSF